MTMPMTRPVSTPGGWQEWNKMYRWRAKGFLYRVVTMLPFSLVMVISMKSTLFWRRVGIHWSPPLLMAAWNAVQFSLSISGSALWSQIPKPSSINLCKKDRQELRKGRIYACSWIATKRLATEGAGDIPIAMPRICFTIISTNLIWLLCMTISMAEMRAFGG